MKQVDYWIECKSGRGLRFYDPTTGIIYDRDPGNSRTTAYSIHNRINALEFIPLRLVDPIDAWELLTGAQAREPIKI
jgi:hypothetical protein